MTAALYMIACSLGAWRAQHLFRLAIYPAYRYDAHEGEHNGDPGAISDARHKRGLV